ncbi:hypothetical protein GP486_005761, partial [Trichoglossum hirsutum]
MSGPVNFGDIVRAIEICVWIREKCFDPVNNAHIKYAEFKQDFLDLEQRLQQLQSAFEGARFQLEASDSSSHALIKLEAEELVGDFKSTLKDCKALLEKYVKLDRQNATVLDNAFWHVSTQGKVAELRRRIQSHTYKIWLVVQPVQLGLVTDIAANVNEIRELLMVHLVEVNQLPEIPSSLQTRFRDALIRDCPPRLSDPRHIPLKEGFDALSQHFRQSTVQAIGSGINPTVEQYLNLLKAHWLVEILSKSESFKQTRQGSLFRRIVEQVKQGIAEQYAREGISRWSEEALGALNDSAFAIWPEQRMGAPPAITEPTSREEKLAEMTLVPQYPYEKQDLVIFRVSYKTLRIVQSQTLRNQSLNQQVTEKIQTTLDLHFDGLVPRYTVAPSHEKKWCLQITDGKGAGSVVHELQGRGQALEFQRAFVDYEAVSCFEHVSCAVTYRPHGKVQSLFRTFVRDDQSTGHGEIQLWQWPVPADSNGPPVSTAAPPAVNDMRSTRSGSSRTAASRTFEGLDPSIVSIREGKDGGELVVAEMPPPPLLMAFAEKKSIYTILQTEVSDLEISESRPAESRTFRTVLRHHTKDPFTVRKLSVKESELGSWNILALILPGHPASTDKRNSAVGRLECTYLALDFTSTGEQERFELYFEAVLGQRLKQRKEFELGRRRAQIQSHKPGRGPAAETRSTRRLSTESSTLTRASRVS